LTSHDSCAGIGIAGADQAVSRRDQTQVAPLRNQRLPVRPGTSDVFMCNSKYSICDLQFLSLGGDYFLAG
jgi:hypothetical protein